MRRTVKTTRSELLHNLLAPRDADAGALCHPSRALREPKPCHSTTGRTLTSFSSHSDSHRTSVAPSQQPTHATPQPRVSPPFRDPCDVSTSRLCLCGHHTRHTCNVMCLNVSFSVLLRPGPFIHRPRVFFLICCVSCFCVRCIRLYFTFDLFLVAFCRLWFVFFEEHTRD